LDVTFFNDWFLGLVDNSVWMLRF